MLLQPKLNLKVSQRQVLTPGLVQMVSVLALNKLELKEMINSEMVENPVLEELEESAATLEERSGDEGDRERSAEAVAEESKREEKDPFDEIDFGSYFQEYLDPGFKVASNFEEYDKPSFEHFLAQPSTLSDHLLWQLGSLTMGEEVRAAAELIVGNLDANGYLTTSDAEMAEALAEGLRVEAKGEPIPFERGLPGWGRVGDGVSRSYDGLELGNEASAAGSNPGVDGDATETWGTHSAVGPYQVSEVGEHAAVQGWLRAVEQARSAMHQLDPVGVAARDLRECLLIQIAAQRREAAEMLQRRGEKQIPFGSDKQNGDDVFAVAAHVVGNCLGLLQKKDMRELTKSCGRTPEEVQTAVEYIRTLDPRPGQRYNVSETRLIEPDVAFVKRDDEYVVVMNEEDMPTLRLSGSYRKMLRGKNTEKEVREYVKERYKSAIQLLRNIEQRKNTIVRTCEAIVRRQGEFLERGEQALKPMMIKEVAEEIGVHPSTVSRAVANKYVHTTQGVYELRFFFQRRGERAGGRRPAAGAVEAEGEEADRG